MIVLGIDCGSEITGYGVVDGDGGKLRYIDAGAIRVSARDGLPKKLHSIFTALQEVIVKNRPDCVAIENVFYAVNAKSALKLGHVRGVAMLAASSAGLPVAEYAPLAIKSAVVGYGKAEKSQVQNMVTRLLSLDVEPDPPDVADALAIAICHIHTAATLRKQGAATRS
jgi:crossover junction endodeoxyribonuclease RuvC